MKVSIHSNMFTKFPRMRMGLVVAHMPESPSTHAIDSLVNQLKTSMMQQGFQETDPVQSHPKIKVWRDTFDQFGVKGSKFPSSVEALSKRAFKDQFPRIFPSIDVYNATSVQHCIPMGGYDMEKLQGDVQLKIAGEAGQFLGIGSTETVQVDPQHVVYQDREDIICWLWNYKDAQRTSITENTRQAVFIFDCADTRVYPEKDLIQAIQGFGKNLLDMGATPLKNAILGPSCPEVEIEADLFAQQNGQIHTCLEEEDLSESTHQETADEMFFHITNHDKMVEILRQHPMSVFTKDQTGHTLFMRAAVNGSNQLINYALFQLGRLVESGRVTQEEKKQILNSVSTYGETALHTCARHQRVGSFLALQAAGADSAVVNQEGKTPQQVAMEKGDLRIGLHHN